MNFDISKYKNNPVKGGKFGYFQVTFAMSYFIKNIDTLFLFFKKFF